MQATHYAETFTNETKGHVVGEHVEPIEGTVFEDMTPGEAFRWLLREYGRCVSKVYVDLPDKPAAHVGWVFEKRDRHEDTGETYLRHVWVTFLERCETTTTREYLDLSQ